MMINPKDIEEFYLQNKAQKITFHTFSKELQIYAQFALYYYDLSNLIDIKSEDNLWKIFPISFTSVKQSCSFLNYGGRYQFISVLGDALVSGNFHAGIVLNRNLMSVNYLCQLIDEYIDSYPKNDKNELDSNFLKLLFFHGNMSNQTAVNYVIKKSCQVLINYKEIDKVETYFNLSRILTELGDIIFCKNCYQNKKLCENSYKFIKFLMDNSPEETIQSILKYLTLNNGYQIDGSLEHSSSNLEINQSAFIKNNNN